MLAIILGRGMKRAKRQMAVFSLLPESCSGIFVPGERGGIPTVAEKAGTLPAYSAYSFWIIRFNRSTVSEWIWEMRDSETLRIFPISLKVRCS